MGNYTYDVLISVAILFIIIFVLSLIFPGIIRWHSSIDERRARRAANSESFWKSEYSIYSIIGVFLLLLTTLPSIKSNPYRFFGILLAFLLLLFIYIGRRVNIL
jgi:hypothetical protein